MIVVGLTGSIGMGKSTVAAMFRQEGVPVFDADAVVHELQGPDGRLVAAIEKAFPGSTSAAGVDRQKLGTAVFESDEKMKVLEGIVHPAVAEEREAFLQAHRSADIIVYDIPLLFEKGTRYNLDTIMVVSAPSDVQRTRVLARPGMTPQKFEAILARQMPDAEKRARADHIIDTSASLADTKAAVQRFVACLRASKRE